MHFGNLHPQDKKVVQKKAMLLLSEAYQAEKPTFPQMKTIEIFSPKKGRIEQPVRILHNRVVDDRGQVIVKAYVGRAVKAEASDLEAMA